MNASKSHDLTNLLYHILFQNFQQSTCIVPIKTIPSISVSLHYLYMSNNTHIHSTDDFRPTKNSPFLTVLKTIHRTSKEVCEIVLFGRNYHTFYIFNKVSGMCPCNYLTRTLSGFRSCCLGDCLEPDNLPQTNL